MKNCESFRGFGYIYIYIYPSFSLSLSLSLSLCCVKSLKCMHSNLQDLQLTPLIKIPILRDPNLGY